ncbi:MAG: hypothetical protein M1335_05165 [Chloroflexi bacterium]|nr:hypothetical protein [Chloroflexota bacterium]
MGREYILAGIAIFTMLINLPFGRWRAGVRTFSLKWWLSIHIPIPVIFVLRRSFGFDWRAIPILFLADVAGQFIGSRLLAKWAPKKIESEPVS